MKRCARFMKRCLASPAGLAAVAGIVIMIAALFVHPLIGMADNGDFFRTINGQGIYKLDRYEEDQYFQYFSSKYGIYQYYNDWEKSLFSSQNLYIRAALLLNRVFSQDSHIFDIRFLAVLLAAGLAAGIYLLVDYIAWKKSRAQGLLLGAACVLMFADTAYTAYFNSFYGEGLVFVSTLLLTASALLLTQKRYPPFPLLLSVAVNGAVLILSKQQNATEGLPLFLLCMLAARFFPYKGRGFRRTAVCAAVLLAGCGVVMYAIIPEDFVRINQYHSMTRGALMTGENPEETLNGFGIDSQYSVLDGSVYYERYPSAEVESEQLAEGFYDKYSFVSLTVYYLTHPGELAVMLDKAAANGYSIRPAAQGNYEREAGREPGERTGFFTLYSTWKEKHVPNTLGFAVIWMLVVCGISFQDRQKLMVILCVIMMGLIQIGTSIVGAGDADLSKHIFLYNVAFDLVSFLCLAPPLTSLVLNLMKGVQGFLRRRGKKVLACLLAAACIAVPPAGAKAVGKETPVSGQETPAAGQAAAGRESAVTRVLLIGHEGKERDRLAGLAEACGMQVAIAEGYDGGAIEAAGVNYIITTQPGGAGGPEGTGIPAIYIGPGFTPPGVRLAQCRNKAVRFRNCNYAGETTFLEEAWVISGGTGATSGRIVLGDGTESPFAVLAEDGSYYVPCYQEDNIGARVLLGELLKELSGIRREGKTYFLMDEVYVFSDLNKLCGWADRLHGNGTPFLIRVMPLYDNLDYPAFLRFAQVLKYMQARGGTIVIHDPLIVEQQAEREPLEDKMARFEQALEREGIAYRTLTCTPLALSREELTQLISQDKDFGRLPFDMMTGVTPEMKEEEFDACIAMLNRKWLSFDDLQTEYGNSTFLYYEEEVPEDDSFQREEEEALFADFFQAGDRVLTAVVGGSLAVLASFLVIGRKWYKKKFYR